jgi:HEAT repeat protein
LVVAAAALAGCGDGDPGIAGDASESAAAPADTTPEAGSVQPSRSLPPDKTTVHAEGNRAVAELLLEDALTMLRSSDPAARIRGGLLVATMGESGMPAREELIRASKADEIALRITALDALAAIGAPREILPDLLRRLDTATWIEGEAAVRALEKTEGRESVATLLLERLQGLGVGGSTDRRALYIMGLGACGATSDEAKLEVLDAVAHTSGTVRAGALRALPAVAGTSEPVVRMLVTGLADTDEFVRLAATQALIYCGPAAAAPLKQAIAGTSGLLRVSAAAAVLRFDPTDAGAGAALLAALTDVEWRVRSAAAQSCGSLRGFAASTVGPLCETMRDSEALVAADAARSLGALGILAEEALPALAAAADSGDTLVRLAAAAALQEIWLAQKQARGGAPSRETVVPTPSPR